MDPISLTAGTMATVAMGAQAGGGILSAFGSIFGGQAQSDMYKYQAGVARVNEQIMKQNEDWALRTGEVEAQQSGMATRFRLGQIKAGQAAGGLDVAKGSAALVRDSEEQIGQYNEELIRSNAAKRAYGFGVEAMGLEAQARGEETAAENARTAGYINAFGSLLGTAGSVASKWRTAKQYGIYSWEG